MRNINPENYRLLLAAFMEREDLVVRKVAKVIGCSEASLTRILSANTLPTNELMTQGGILFTIGFKKYSALSKKQKSRIAENIGTSGGGILGFSTITSTISALGIPGLSAAGITSGLATLGSIVGGGMLAGISIAAAIPIAAGVAGYGIIKGIRYLVDERQLNTKIIDKRWEIRPSPKK